MGFTPQTTEIALAMALVSMICWGSWANVMKKVGNWRFESFYWDYAWSIVFWSFILGILLGGFSETGWGVSNVKATFGTLTLPAIGFAGFSGIVWGIGNILAVVTILLTGYAVAFPIIVGLATILGTLLAYLTNPSATAHPEFLFMGIVVMTVAVGLNAIAYRIKEQRRAAEQGYFFRGILLAVCSGVLIALFAFPFNYAFRYGANGYTGALLMSMGGFIVAFLLLPFLMRHPFIPGQQPIGFSAYRQGKLTWHLWIIFGALIWSIGTTFNLVVAAQPQFGVAVAYALGQAAPMVAALWGIFVWKEFKNTARTAYIALSLMFFLYIVAIYLFTLAAGSAS